MYGWGNMRNGELGLGGLEEDVIPAPRALSFPSSPKIQSVGCGDNHTVLALQDGRVFSFGSNDFGQLGHTKPRTRPEQVDCLDAQVIRRLACGARHTLALNEWGQVFAWGSNATGQLGLNAVSAEPIVQIPKIVKSLATKHVVQIACGQNHSLALTNVGELYAWGSNSHGQLGLGYQGPAEGKPCEVKSLRGIPIAFIACGGDHSFAVSCSGVVHGWGKNAFGQLGVGDTTDRTSPTQLRSFRSLRVAFIACGRDHTAALTRDGGVFTFGAGMYGQLGHATTLNEMLPRQVLELMGSTVTQVTCGRCHTMAFVPASGRVYAFGLGGSGQLGLTATQNVNSPQPLVGLGRPTVNGTTLTEPDPSGVVDCAVRQIVCGGDQSFALVSPSSEESEPADFRERPPETQILTILPGEIKKLRSVGADVNIDLDLMRYAETVFSHLACYNASFLRSDGSHYGDSLKKHGLDLELARETFDQLSRVENPALCELLHRSICSDLLPSLVPGPPDTEALRVYLLLPLYHEFLQARHFDVLQCPLAAAILALKPEPAKVLELWLSSMKSDFFIRLINIFKQVVVYVVSLPSAWEHPEQGSHASVNLVPVNRSVATLRAYLVVCLDLLRKLNSINRQGATPKVGHEVFHIPELTERVDVKQDYVKWLSDPIGDKRFRLCNYPFVFDAIAKTQLLMMDQNIQMQLAVQEAVQRVQFNPFAARDPARIQFLVLEVRRSHIAYDTMSALDQRPASDLKKPLKVKFHGEEAEDAGGVRKEFFMLLLKEILDPKYGMFTDYEETRSIWFSELEFDEQGMYFYLIGLLCGLAIYNFTIINLPFPLVLYKKLLGEAVGLDDLAGLSPTLFRSLHSLLDYEGDDVEDVFGLYFAISREVLGQVRTDELKPQGADTPVTQQNKQEYVDLYVDFLLNKSIAKHFDAFNEGFHKVCGGRVLRLFQSNELMELVVGNENYDWYELQRNAMYKNGYSADHPTVRLFWEVFHDLSHEQKKMFLLYLTGSDRIPILGMNAVKVILQRTSGGDSYLPVAHTCFNLLDLPQYNTKEKLRYKLLQAIQQTQGFALA